MKESSPPACGSTYCVISLAAWTRIVVIYSRLLKAIGSGEFGNVYKAVWSISGSTKEVAVKTLKPGSSENDTVRFLQEAAIMGQFNHPYIVKLYGVVTLEDPVSICFLSVNPHNVLLCVRIHVSMQ